MQGCKLLPSSSQISDTTDVPSGPRIEEIVFLMNPSAGPVAPKMEIANDFLSLHIEETIINEGAPNLTDDSETMSTESCAGWRNLEHPTFCSDPVVTLRRTRRECARAKLAPSKSMVCADTRTRNKLILKRPEHNLDTDKKICSFYTNVNKNWKTKHTNLETIFEEPKESRDGSEMTMSKARLRRSLVFNNRITKAKKEKRRKAISKNKSEVIKAKIAKSGV